jgi:hypothetical protein
MESLCIDGLGCLSSSNVAVLSLSGISGQKEAGVVIAKRSSPCDIAASFRSELATPSPV